MTLASRFLIFALLPLLWLQPVWSSEPILPPPKNTLRLILDWYPSPQHAPIFLVKALGYLEPENMELDIVTPADPSVPSKLVAASRADLALTRQSNLHLQIDKGRPLIRVATLIDSPLVSLTVRDDSGITEIAQLAGKRIGFTVKDNLQPDLATLLIRSELTLDDVLLENVDFGVVQALVQRQVDAVIGGQRPTFSEQLRREGVRSRDFLIEEFGVPPYDGLILIANRNHLQRQRKSIQHLVSAIERASLWLVNHPQQAWQRLIEIEPGLDTLANRRAWPAVIQRFSLSPAGLDSHRYMRFEEFLKDRGDISAIHPVSRLAVDIFYAP